MKYLGAMIFALALAAPVAAQTGPATDLFAFSQGARLVQVPDDAEFTAMDSSPLNLIDGSATTDWTGEAGRPAVFVLELAERTELSRVAFDTAFLNRDEKSPRAIRVELSDTSARSGFVPILAADLKMKKDGQSFGFDPEHRPVGRWVRLTIASNYGDDYTGLTGFHGYGRQLTATATLPDVTGRYEGWSGWGTLNLTQNGDTVTGCYEYQAGRVTGRIDGRVLTLDMVETGPDGAPRRLSGYFGLTPDGGKLIGFARGLTESDRLGYATYMSADRRANRPGACR